MDLIDWETEQTTEPPLTMSLSDEVILSALEKPLILDFYPNHTQTVERTVKVVTESCLQKVGYVARHRYPDNILVFLIKIHNFKVDPVNPVEQKASP